MPTRNIRISACQPEDIIGDISQAVSVMAQSAQQAEHDGAKLICFPECYLQGYVLNADHIKAYGLSLASTEFYEILERLKSLNIIIVFGMIEIESGAFYNTAVVIKQGVLQGRYRKANLLRSEATTFTAGIDCPVFDLDGLRFGINICKDLNDPECASRIATQGAQLLVCPCNNMLKIDNAEIWKEKHNAIRALRCTESSLWLVSSDVTGERPGHISYGPTAVINPDGQVVAQVRLNRPGMLIYDIAV